MESRPDDQAPLLVRPVPPTAERIDKRKFLGVFAVLGLILVAVFAVKLQSASTTAQAVQPAPLPGLGEVNTLAPDQILQVPKSYAGLDRRPPKPPAPPPDVPAPSPFETRSATTLPGALPVVPPPPPAPPGAPATPTAPKAAAPPPRAPAPEAKPAPKRWLFADLSNAVAAPPFPTGRPGREEGGRASDATSTGAPLLRPARQERPVDPSRVLYRSQVIPGILLHEMHSDIPGQVRIMVTQPVTDRFHQGQILIPQASILLGVQEQKPAFGQNRLAVKIEEVHTPEGAVIALPGQLADRGGAAGVKGKVNNHYGAIGVAALLSAALNVGARTLAGEPSGLQLNVAQELAREAGQSVNRTAQSIVERTLNIPPRITLKAGTPVTIELAENLVLPSRAPVRQ